MRTTSVASTPTGPMLALVRRGVPVVGDRIRPGGAPLAVVFEQGKVAHHVALGGAMLVLSPGEVQTGVGG
jgi:hypothetical protein